MSHIIADIVFVLVGVLIVIISAKHGFFKTLTRFARVFLAIVFTYIFGNLLAPWLANTFSIFSNATVAMVFSYVFVFLGSIVLITVFTWFVGALIERMPLVRKIDMLLGAAVGLLSAVILLFIAASIMKYLPASREMYSQTAVIKFFGDQLFFKSIPIFNVGKAWFESSLA